jgi:hypothetical protein
MINKTAQTLKTSILFVFIILTFSSSLFAQTLLKGQVIEKNSKLPIAFASVFYKKQLVQKGLISDVHGKFEIYEQDIHNITITCVGYKQNKVTIENANKSSSIIIELEPYSLEINEIIITPGVNPALRIIKNALLNKPRNNYELYSRYSYNCYVKTIIDTKISNDASAQDSLKLFKNERFKNTGFISECVLSCLKNNKQSESKIIAQKTSGLKDPLFSQAFVSMFHHAISFYNNSISLFELPISNNMSMQEYISPLADNCLSCYNFTLDNTYANSNDSIFVINFYPKKGKNFNSLKGKLFISSNGFAIKSIVVEPDEKSLIGFKFKQDYDFINGKWFPTNLDEEIGFIKMKLTDKLKAYPVYLVTSRIDSINYQPSFENRKISLENVYVDTHSLKNSVEILKKSRPDTLTLKEETIYHTVDSIGKKYNFDYWAKLIPKLSDGKIPVSYFDIDLNKLYNYNSYEGDKVGIGLSTNDKIFKNVSLGGYVVYGFKDQEIKHGGYIIVNFNKYNEVRLKLSYQNNLKEVGLDLNSNIGQLNDYIRSQLGNRFDKCVEKKAEFSFRTLRFIKITTALSLRDITPTYSYTFKNKMLANYASDEFQISAKYAYGEKLETLGNERISNFAGNPIINFTYRRGLNLFRNQSYQYNRVEATVDLTAYKGTIGQSTIHLAAGLIDKSLPYGLLFTGEGCSNSNIQWLATNYFQTMSPYEFLSDRYVNLFLSHNFGSLLFKTKRFKPQFIIVQNTGWGMLQNANVQGIDFKQKNKIYLESGLVINNIIKFNCLNMFYIGVGVGGFYRYGYYANADFNHNFALKLSTTISLK